MLDQESSPTEQAKEIAACACISHTLTTRFAQHKQEIACKCRKWITNTKKHLASSLNKGLKSSRKLSLITSSLHFSDAMNMHGLYAEVQHMLELSLSHFHALPPYSERDYCSQF